MRIHHTGIIVRNLAKSIGMYEKLGFKKESEITEDEQQQNRILFMYRTEDGFRIELIEKMNERSSVIHFNPGVHHICYEVENPVGFEDEFRKMKIGKIFTKPMKAPAIRGRQVVFAYLLDGSLAEFLLQ